ncbi:uncharacterized protein LAESUDRAFT_496370 [Laetiporus sulphureus 93-53]|uniref:Inner centromere protein ARK-binding domain-containing protein n=1 Tax=Laetiporus sulphureus 93-53 TaxID=1314785 RepID=A0A165BGT7_9APHY|nr:uncharacterized protein LAESUDRAFT_496370 [Laetiporus sulphureus 93-53]KZT01027.1 hypothetical protein LAESUDRAFT_496370 [Laetiporus sulphureus 93-53]
METPHSGEDGVLAWCNSIRLSMAQDRGRQFLGEQVQNTVEYLDSYLDNVRSGSKIESVADLLKTPGRKRTAPSKVRVGTTGTMKMKPMLGVDVKQENGPEQEKQPSINGFHRALLQAKAEEDDPVEVFDDLKLSGTTQIAKLLNMSAPKRSFDSLDPVAPMSTSLSNPSITSPSDQGLISSTISAYALHSDAINKELSVIAEDDESAERSRASLPAPISRPHDSPPEQDTHHDEDDAADMDLDEVVRSDITITSSHTFNSIPLDSPRGPSTLRPSTSAPPNYLLEDYYTEPLPRVDREPLPQDETHAFTAPLPTILRPAKDQHANELAAPARDGLPTAHSAPVLSRKPSLSQIGLPAPLPPHKSTRLTHESSTSAALGPMPSIGSKRGSWLVRAREVKAAEMTGKRMSNALGSGSGADVARPFAIGTKRKSGEMLSAGTSDGPSTASGAEAGPSSRATEDDERLQKVAKVAKDDGDSFLHKQKVTSMMSEGHPTLQKAASAPTEEPHPSPRPTRAPSTPPRQSPLIFAHKPSEDFTVPLRASDDDDEVLHQLRRKVEGLGARSGKSMGKSLGGNAAAALAQARADAEARVAERNKVKGSDDDAEEPSTPNELNAPQEAAAPAPVIVEAPSAPSNGSRSEDNDRSLSVSALTTSKEKEKKTTLENATAPPSTAPPVDSTKPVAAQPANASTSTTPPSTPPHISVPVAHQAPPPVFSKPPIVFTAPSAASSKPPHPRTATNAGPASEFSFKPPTAHPFFLPPPKVGSGPAPSKQLEHEPPALSAQSSKASVLSDAIFDKADNIPAWMPATQDTEYSTALTHLNDLEDDDSWRIDEQLAPNEVWTPFTFPPGDKDDTWSTMTTKSTSQKGGDTGPVTQNFTRTFLFKDEGVQEGSGPSKQHVEPMTAPPVPVDTGARPVREEKDTAVADVAMEADPFDIEGAEEADSEPKEDIPASQPIAGPTKPKAVPNRPRSQSQQSLASTASSSQTQLGFFGHASKLVSSVLGGSKKGKAEPLKSLQLAAQAAKKQQEEDDKKATRLKEMETRRLQVQQKKAEEDKARALEEERRFKEETERRKREREEHTEKRPLKGFIRKGDEDNTKKRKFVADNEKKPEAKKPPSKDKKDAIPLPRVVAKPGTSSAPGSAMKIGPPPKSALKQPSAPVKHTGGTAAATSSKQDGPHKAAPATDAKILKTIKSTPSSSSLKQPSATTSTAKAKVRAPNKDEDERQPTQSQASNRAKAPMQTPQRPPPPVASESIELPDINSEYSDSEDEDRPRSFERPEWAQSPELRQALQQQSTMNPDDIFGAIEPLRMEDIFRTRQSRFRARTSSANWTGTDQLTQEEERDYARRMGFR